MNRIQKIFKNRTEKVIPYITAGYPKLDQTIEIVLAAERAGADMIELGMPFSDPLADGPVIQRSSQAAINNGVNVSWILDLVNSVRKQSEIPLTLMGYINPIIKYGLNSFLKDAKSGGVDGLIIPDLPPEEAAEYIQLSREYDISPILLVAPNSSGERIEYISKLAGDLVYCVAILGITGTSEANFHELKLYLDRVYRFCRAPYIVGFGIKTRENIIAINQFSHGAVVGSELIQRQENSKDAVKTTFQYISELKGNK